eukprot:scaffold13625_cov20-Tisochrysis_lutea.AAC.7
MPAVGRHAAAEAKAGPPFSMAPQAAVAAFVVALSERYLLLPHSHCCCFPLPLPLHHQSAHCGPPAAALVVAAAAAAACGHGRRCPAPAHSRCWRA